MSMFSIASSSVQSGLATVCAERIEIDHDEIDRRDAGALERAHVRRQSRRARMPPCTFGCSVLTRPSSISGKAGIVGDFGDRRARRPAAAAPCRRWRSA